jgi:hypothetical protein
MKLQYLGDPKDSFKWDYHDFLMSALQSELKFEQFTIALMLTDDSSKPDPRFKKEIVNFCEELRNKRIREEIQLLKLIEKLPLLTKAFYSVSLHKVDIFFSNSNRDNYFSNFDRYKQPQLIFLDPDNGFQPEKSCTEKHVCYSDIPKILAQLTKDSIISVFQFFRFISFEEDYNHICERLSTIEQREAKLINISSEPIYTTAIFWPGRLMFVAISRSENAIGNVRKANEKYKNGKPQGFIEVIP